MIHPPRRTPFILDSNIEFPNPELALSYPAGLLAIGGDLSSERLITAYTLGIFPWFSDNEPILWWTLDPRLVLPPTQLKISHSLKKELKKFAANQDYRVTVDHSFKEVMRACAMPRNANNNSTWINTDMLAAYTELHTLGIAHSIEVWHHNELVGGLYGISLGKVFFGESMFSRQSNMSKLALAYLCQFLNQQGVQLIDCQQQTSHLQSLGAFTIRRTEFQQQLKQWTPLPSPAWVKGVLLPTGTITPLTMTSQ